MARFVWLTPYYRINIESVFSLEEKIDQDISQEYKSWVDLYEKEISYIHQSSDELIEYFKGKENFDLTNITEDNLKEYIYFRIGYPPPQHESKYFIILSTGLKINVLKDKYDIINKHIDQMMSDNSKLNVVETQDYLEG